jgi:hypothetical protein
MELLTPDLSQAATQSEVGAGAFLENQTLWMYWSFMSRVES